MAAIALLWAFLRDGAAALAAAVGALLPLGGDLILGRCRRQGEKLGVEIAPSLGLLYRCAGYRIVWAILFFGIVFALLKLEPLPLFCGVIVAQWILLFGNWQREG
ncbi:MAG: hypothetical protein HQL48_02470 [Gammaproteobacteria bacterium]|nr:hypothetical protein [Gammaproteobacteria bacterium]